jgi:LysR family transcriptional activator of nhaA
LADNVVPRGVLPVTDPGALNFRHLYQFWIVAREGSLVGAGRRLGLSHSTISSQLRALEDQLDGRLLLRRPRGVRLTPLGETVQAYCNEIFRLGAELQEAAAGSQARGGRLVVGTVPSVPRTLLLDVLRPALAGSPPVRLQLACGSLPGICDDLIGGRLHAALLDRLPTRAVDAQLHPRVVAESRIALYGARRLADRHRRGFPASLAGAPVLLPGPAAPLRQQLDAWFATAGIRPRVVGEFDDAPTLRRFAAAGLGLAPIRVGPALRLEEREGLAFVGSVPGAVDRLYLLTVGRRVRHDRLQAVIDQSRQRQAAR